MISLLTGFIRHFFYKEELTVEEPFPLLVAPHREFVADMFPLFWTHFDNLSQEDLLRIVITLNLFGFQITSVEDLTAAFAELVDQNIIEYSTANIYVLRRVINLTLPT